jgi:molecular chaperone HtpG
MKKEEEDFLDKFRIDHIVKTYSDHIAVPIHMINEEGQEEEVLNSSSALWVRSKSDISEEEYKTFYHNVAHTGDEPWAILLNKAEGALEYTNLLYIPTVKPIDLFHPERKNRIKLYVKRVFITDENINLLPAYLRFVQGVVDSEDVPLNISRENLQHNAVITRISRALSKKILSEIKKKSEKDPESFDKFWKNFGPVIKEGLCDATIDRDAILDVCAFKTSKSNDKYISLKQYIENMKEGQENIFYLTGEDENAIKKSPKLEGFLKREIEVLLLTDSVDDFWVNVVNEYKDKTFQSINRTNIDLDSISPATELENKKDGEIEEVEAENVDEINALIEFLKETLKDRVSDIKISEKLVTSPACLSVGEHGMDIRMERFLVEQKQLPAASAKIFEVNVKHPIMKTIIADIKIDTESERAKELSLLLFDQACIIEGESVKDINAFSQRVNEFIQKALAA